MANIDEVAIQELLRELMAAWNRGDAKAYGARFRADGTFTNVNGAFFVGRDEFDHRHAEVFRGVFKGSGLALTIRKLRFVRPDVAVADIEVALSDCDLRPPGVQPAADGTLHTCLMLVLLKEDGAWWITAYHNVWQSAAR
jgi:uncharacterized protein (TIGR02246 family)